MAAARYNFVKVYVADLEKMVGFYQAAFDFELEGRFSNDEFDEVLLRQPGAESMFGLLQWKDGRDANAAPTVGVIGMVADDIDASLAQATKAGAKITTPLFEAEGMRIAMAHDPEGNEIEFVQFP